MERRALLICVLISSSGACSDDALSESDQSIVTTNKIAGNKIAANKIAANKIAANKIAANKIAANKIAGNKIAGNKLAANKLAVGELLETADGREVLSFLVSCALPDGTSIVATADDGTEYEFPGGVGLVPSWTHRPLDGAEKRWISACLFARVNAHGVEVTISLRGPNRALDVSPEEAAGWPLEEGAFYGDYFTAPDEPIVWIACRGRDQAAGETGGLVDRDCAEPDPTNPGLTQCGFTFAGDCADFAPPRSSYACRDRSDEGFYVNCADHAAFHEHGHDRDHGRDWRDETYRQVITTFVTR